MPRHSHSRLDPRAPLVLDTRELGRRAGSLRRVSRTVPAPGGLTGELVRVPAGSDIGLALRLEAVMDGVLVSGDVRVDLVGECGRCLEPVAQALDVEFQELYLYPGQDVGDPDTAWVEDDLIDLEPSLRDHVVLALPLTPLCAPDCAGLCATCGDRLADSSDEHRHDAVDPRWAALAALPNHTDPPQES